MYEPEIWKGGIWFEIKISMEINSLETKKHAYGEGSVVENMVFM